MDSWLFNSAALQEYLLICCQAGLAKKLVFGLFVIDLFKHLFMSIAVENFKI